MIVMDISRNLLLIMSNPQYVVINNDVTYLLNGKYEEIRKWEIIIISNRFSSLQTNYF